MLVTLNALSAMELDRSTIHAVNVDFTVVFETQILDLSLYLIDIQVSIGGSHREMITLRRIS